MIYVHLATGFEEVEALTTIDVLRRGGLEVKSVSIMDSKMVTGAHDINVEADILFEDADYKNCEMIVLPGGMPGAANLECHEGLKKQIEAFAKAGKKLAAICAAPMVFGTHGLLEGKRATIYPGMEDCLKGGVPSGENVTTDGNITTGKGPALAMEFALSLVEILKGKAVRDEVAEGLLW